MTSLTKYIIITLIIFVVLLIMFYYLALNNITSGFSNVISVLMGSSLTASITLALESSKIEKENNEVETSIKSVIDYNNLILKKIIEGLKNEQDKLETDKGTPKDINHPMPPIKTDLWDIIKVRLDKGILEDNYDKLIIVVANIEYINSHLRKRDDYITNNLGNVDKIDMKILQQINSTLITNIKITIDILDKLSKIYNKN